MERKVEMVEEVDRPDEKSGLPRRSAAEKERPKKAPWPMRLAAWIAVILLCFSLGYFVTDVAVRFFLGRAIFETPQVAQTDTAEDDGSLVQVEVALYVPKDGGLVESSYSFLPSIVEEDITKTIDRLLALLAQEKLVGRESRVLHVFRRGEILYLDLNAAFYDSIKSLQADSALLVVTSIVRTVVDNFRPLQQVRFLANGREVTEQLPVDMSVPWQLASPE